LRANPNDSNQYRMQFAEIEVYAIGNGSGDSGNSTVNNENNYALNKTVTVSSSAENSSWSLSKVVDGERNVVTGNAGWSSNNSLTTNHTEWVSIDLGQAYTVRNVDIYPRNDSGSVGQGFPIDFNIQVSNDNVNWTTVVTITGYTIPGNAVQSFSFSSVSARYVKVVGTSLRANPNDSNQYRMQLAEIEIY